MAKRYTETDKYKDDWFLKLSRDAKLLIQYLNDICDHGGFYKISYYHMKFCIQLNEEETNNALKEFEFKYIMSDNKSKIWLKDYLEEQKNLPLNRHNNAHKGALRCLERQIHEFSHSNNSFIKIPCHHYLRDKTGKVIEDTMENLGLHLKIS